MAIERVTDIDWCLACKACQIKASAVNNVCGLNINGLGESNMTFLSSLGVFIGGLIIGAAVLYWLINKQLTASVNKEVDNKMREIDKNIASRVEAILTEGAKQYMYDSFVDFNQGKMVLRIIKDDSVKG